ncbi:MAG: hypothetical protein SOX80_02975 [Candidatus Fimivivens sp.]|nr:hypothetical protein [Candidatus Fimivivens sp.]SFI58965.1 hypothetical protein SAMN02910435_00386 [Ruminococcaceae bacterium D5]
MIDSERVSLSRLRWRAILGIVTVCVGCACFVLSCVSAMILAGRD